MASHDILYQTSCPHIRYQNEIVERKKEHLIETIRTLLLHSNVPYRFLGNSVLTACYLVIRMSSLILTILFLNDFLHPFPPLFCYPFNSEDTYERQ